MTHIAKIEFAYTDDSRSRVLWSYINGDDETIQHSAIALLAELYGTSIEAQIWINDRPFKPEKRDLAEYHKQLAAQFEQEAEKRASGAYDVPDVDEACDEVQDIAVQLADVDLSDLPELPDVRF